MESVSEKKKHNGKGHDRQFKLAAVKLVQEQGYTPKQAARSLGLHLTTLQYWIKTLSQAPAGRGKKGTFKIILYSSTFSPLAMLMTQHL